MDLFQYAVHYIMQYLLDILGNAYHVFTQFAVVFDSEFFVPIDIPAPAPAPNIHF